MTDCPSKDATRCHRKPHWLRNLDRVSPVPWVSVSLSVKLGLPGLWWRINKVMCLAQFVAPWWALRK